ncbi:hypothetical protein BH24PSE2_BH24PSE2_08920 [soil metagenome]
MTRRSRLPGKLPPPPVSRVVIEIAHRYTRRLVLLAVAATGGAACDSADGPIEGPQAGSSQTLAENFHDFGDYVVHFNALPTIQLAPEVARNYDIVRSENKAMLNIAIIHKVEGTLGKSVPGRVRARAANLTGQLKTVALRKIVEGEAIYYIAEMPVSNGETLIFDVEVSPKNESGRFRFRFQETFYTG